MKILIALFITLAAFASNAAAQTTQPIVPFLEEVIVNPTTGRATAYFGYTNPNSTTVSIAKGEPNNYFTPVPVDRGQPSVFYPGTRRYVFAAVWLYAQDPTSTWVVNGNSATADSATAARQVQATAFTYQGRLSDAASSGGANGTYQMQFQLFDAATNGNQIGDTRTNTAVNVSNGVFTVSLDFGSNPFVSGADRFLQISVKRASDPSGTAYTTLAPRQQLTSSPYAIRTISAGEADSLSNFCVGCVQNSHINSVDAAKVTGTVANATNAQTANTATSANTANTATTATTAGNVTGVVAVANGGTGSSTKNFVDLTTAQTVAGGKTFSNSLRTNGLMRIGSETGTSEAPDVFPAYEGLLIRRINSGFVAAGHVAARTNVLRLERDGSFGGWRIGYDALPGFEYASIHCLGITGAGTMLTARASVNPTAPAGTVTLFTHAQNIEYLQCSFGNPYNYRHQTQVTLQRFPNDYAWTGTLTSTFNQ